MITLEQAKAHLNVTTDIDDDLIASKLAAAKQVVMHYAYIDIDNVQETSFLDVREAVLQITAHFYANREASIVGLSAQHLPFGVLDLLAPYRKFVF